MASEQAAADDFDWDTYRVEQAELYVWRTVLNWLAEDELRAVMYGRVLEKIRDIEERHERWRGQYDI